KREPATVTPAADRTAADAVEPARSGVATAPLARGRPPQALRLPVPRHTGPLRGLPVARAGDPARRRRGDARARPPDREPESGRRWVTRPRPHVDRIASAWLIKRFIDPQAVFVFAPPAEFPKDAIAFDAPGVELSHHGEDCTFETLIKRGRLRDRRLARLAEIVHEADLRDGKYPHEEARGIDVAIRALL